MPQTPSQLVQRLRPVGYVVFWLLALIPLVGALEASFPFRVHQIVWRIAVASQVSAALPTSIVGLFFIFGFALFAGDRASLMIVSVVCAIGALLAVGGSGLFCLDVLEMRAQVQNLGLQRYMADAAWILAKTMLSALALIMIGLGAFRGVRALQRDAAARVSSGKSGQILVGTPRAVTRDAGRAAAVTTESVADAE